MYVLGTYSWINIALVISNIITLKFEHVSDLAKFLRESLNIENLESELPLNVMMPLKR